MKCFKLKRLYVDIENFASTRLGHRRPGTPIKDSNLKHLIILYQFGLKIHDKLTIDKCNKKRGDCRSIQTAWCD